MKEDKSQVDKLLDGKSAREVLSEQPVPEGTPGTPVKIDLDKFVELAVSTCGGAFDSVYEKALIKGYKGLKEEINNLKDYFDSFGYLPESVIYNKDKIVEEYGLDSESLVIDEGELSDNTPVEWI